MVHVVLQYAIDVNNLFIANSKLRFFGNKKDATSLY